MGGNELRTLMDQLKNKLGSGIVLLGSASGDKVSLIAGVTADLTAKVKAGELVNFVAQQVGGKGGGRPDMAPAGGTQDRKSVVKGKSVSVRVSLGGTRVIKKKTNNKQYITKT